MKGKSLVRENFKRENREIEPVGRRRFLGSPPRPALPGGRFPACRYLLVLIMTRGVMVVVVVVAILEGRTPTGPENQDQMILSFFRSENGLQPFWRQQRRRQFCFVLFFCVRLREKKFFPKLFFSRLCLCFQGNFFSQTKKSKSNEAHVTFCRRFGYRYLKT